MAQQAHIVLQGKLTLVYERSSNVNYAPNTLEKVTMVLKGHWKLSNDQGTMEDFIYKKMGPPESEDLLEEYFCDRSYQRIPIKSQSFSN